MINEDTQDMLNIAPLTASQPFSPIALPFRAGEQKYLSAHRALARNININLAIALKDGATELKA